MLSLLEKSITEQRMMPPGTTVLCALSGGGDSVCLMHALYRLRERLGIRLAAAHYNHLLRGEESCRDERFVEEFISTYCPDGVSLTVGRGDVALRAQQTGRGLEETAREMRYEFLRQTAREVGADVIATAHNLNDNAETILMHLLRGSGLRGLGGIAPVRDGLVRPLLEFSREEIETYLRTQGLPYVEDSTNRDERYTRNHIRHNLLPQLEEYAPGLLERMGNMARDLRADEGYLSSGAEELLDAAQVKDGEITFPVAVLNAAPEPVAVRAIRMAMGRLCEGNDNCARVHLKSVLALSRQLHPSGQISLPNGLNARREYGSLVLSAGCVREELPSCQLQLPGETVVGSWRISCEEMTYQGEEQGRETFFLSCTGAHRIQVRSRKTGDRLTRPSRRGKSLKKLMIEEKIPISMRDQLPVLEVAGCVAAAAGLGPDQAFLSQKGERAWKITIHPVNDR